MGGSLLRQNQVVVPQPHFDFEISDSLFWTSHRILFQQFETKSSNMWGPGQRIHTFPPRLILTIRITTSNASTSGTPSDTANDIKRGAAEATSGVTILLSGLPARCGR
mmetsp:Transcript_28537/g.45781  ORF Transcript_28537/g.45781 Transcript_28537/m.45781 type:complete len:108 (-) Transcript_28537:3180-3503(-)